MTESIHHADNSQNAPNNTTICDDDNGAIGLGDELRSNCVNTPSTPATGNTTITETDHPIETIELQPTSSPQQVKLRHQFKNESRFDEGYDSDGNMGPYVNPEVTEDEEIFEDDSLPASEPIHVLAQNKGNGIAEPGTTVSTMPPLDTNVFIPIENELIEKMKVKQLREALKERGESTAGKKDDLLRRLQAAMVAKKPVLSESQREAKAKDNADKGRKIGKGFPPTAQWKSLTVDDTAVVEPENPSFRNP